MSICIGFESALAFYRSRGAFTLMDAQTRTALRNADGRSLHLMLAQLTVGGLDREPQAAMPAARWWAQLPARRPGARFAAEAAHAAALLALFGGDSSLRNRPLDVLVPQSQDVRNSGHVRCHLWQGTVPRHAFLRLGDGVYLSAPEFAFVQLARQRSREELVLLGFELCGTYGADGEGSALFDRVPLTTRNRLLRFAGAAGRFSGCSRARWALRYVCDNAESPMEAKVAALLQVPRRYGGYGLPAPEMGRVVPFGEKGAALAGTDSARCDLFWPGAQVACEYNGAYHYEDPEQAKRDEARTAALAHEGVTALSLSYRQLSDQGQTDAFAASLARKLRVRAKKLSADIAPLRADLRKRLGLP